ncbi:MAG: hypothetical protein JO197_22200 [Acidobacteria bacterium]|nr:hypothetical protein [Acidobacteriota bacterium]MBV9474850.1 hypothetical protein [Acidobacteriota bacterium]
MALTDTYEVPEALRDDIAARFTSLFGVLRESRVALEQSIAVWTYKGEVPPEATRIEEIAEHTGWHHQVRVGERASAFARSRTEQVVEIAAGFMALQIEEIVDGADSRPEVLIRILDVPEQLLQAVWLKYPDRDDLYIVAGTGNAMGQHVSGAVFLALLGREPAVTGVEL